MPWKPQPADLTEFVKDMVELDPNEHRGLLVVLPHPDDETFAAGGTIARFADAGKPVLYLCGTYGDSGRRMGSPFFANRESLRDIREVELGEACQELGCSFRMLGLRDKTVEFEDPERVAGLVRDVIDEFRPSVVITFYPGYGVHPDHDALGHATELAVTAIDAAERPLLLGVAVGNKETLEDLGQPQVFSDIRAVADRKLEALRAHRSQTQFLFQRMEVPEAKIDEQTRTFRDEAFSAERFYVLPRVA